MPKTPQEVEEQLREAQLPDSEIRRIMSVYKARMEQRRALLGMAGAVLAIAAGVVIVRRIRRP
jgi:hypothetical protein